MNAPLLTQQQVAKLLGVSTRTVRSLNIRRVKISNKLVRYRPEDVQRFVDRRAK